jgi:hypothetical protein
VNVERQTAEAAARTAQGLGLAAILGGNLFARVGMHPALREVSDPRERGKVVNAAWRRYGTVNSLALAAVIAGWAGSRSSGPGGGDSSSRERVLSSVRDAAVAALATTGVAAGIEGMRFSRLEPQAAVPLRDGSEPAAEASPAESRAKRRLNALGAAHLASALALAGASAPLAHRGPPDSRSCKHWSRASSGRGRRRTR